MSPFKAQNAIAGNGMGLETASYYINNQEASNQYHHKHAACVTCITRLQEQTFKITAIKIYEWKKETFV